LFVLKYSHRVSHRKFSVAARGTRRHEPVATVSRIIVYCGPSVLVIRTKGVHVCTLSLRSQIWPF